MPMGRFTCTESIPKVGGEMGRLSSAVVGALKAANSIAPNAYVQFLRQAVAEVDAAEETSPALKLLVDELVDIASARNFSLNSAAVNAFAQKLGEAHFLALCALKGVHLQKVPEESEKSPDFMCSIGRDLIHFEVKTLSVVNGESGIDDDLERAFKSQGELERLRASGEPIAMVASEIVPYGRKGKGRPPPRLVVSINTILEKARSNLKEGQFARPNTFLVINLSMIPPSLTEPRVLRPVYCDDSSFPTGVTGDLWMIGFGRQGMLIHDVPEFEGKPCIQGTFEKAGLLTEYDFVGGLLIVVHPWRQPAEVWGLFRETDWSSWQDHPEHPCARVFDLVGRHWNDEVDSNGFSLNGDDDVHGSATNKSERS